MRDGGVGVGQQRQRLEVRGRDHVVVGRERGEFGEAVQDTGLLRVALEDAAIAADQQQCHGERERQHGEPDGGREIAGHHDGRGALIEVGNGRFQQGFEALDGGLSGDMVIDRISGEAFEAHPVPRPNGKDGELREAGLPVETCGMDVDDDGGDRFEARGTLTEFGEDRPFFGG